IRAYPDDDAPRLIFADWLDEQGTVEAADRAEFIRVQVALAQMSPDDPRRPTLLIAERELLDAYKPVWDAPFAGLASNLVYRRGFVEEVRVGAREYLLHAHELFAAGPIRHIHLIDVGEALAAVLASP